VVLGLALALQLTFGIAVVTQRNTKDRLARNRSELRLSVGRVDGLPEISSIASSGFCSTRTVGTNVTTWRWSQNARSDQDGIKQFEGVVVAFFRVALLRKSCLTSVVSLRATRFSRDSASDTKRVSTWDAVSIDGTACWLHSDAIMIDNSNMLPANDTTPSLHLLVRSVPSM
jgi:hypothetical protein